MFNSIQGMITHKENDILYLQCGGIEWEITVPATDIASLPSVGSEARIYVWLYHREDQMRLFGFADTRRRNTFHALVKVEGIGPKQAVKIMGGISQEELERALDTEDLGRLEAVPGLGKKTAQKMILALKGKIAHESPDNGTSGPWSELVRALGDMGYDKKAAADAVAKAAAGLEGSGSKDEQEKQLFKQAILLLSGM